MEEVWSGDLGRERMKTHCKAGLFPEEEAVGVEVEIYSSSTVHACPRGSHSPVWRPPGTIMGKFLTSFNFHFFPFRLGKIQRTDSIAWLCWSDGMRDVPGTYGAQMVGSYSCTVLPACWKPHLPRYSLPQLPHLWAQEIVSPEMQGWEVLWRRCCDSPW